MIVRGDVSRGRSFMRYFEVFRESAAGDKGRRDWVDVGGMGRDGSGELKLNHCQRFLRSPYCNIRMVLAVQIADRSTALLILEQRMTSSRISPT